MENSTLATNGTSPAFKADLHTGLVGEAATSAHDAVDKAAAYGHQTVNSIEDKVKPAERWVNQTTDAVLAVPKNAVSDARQYITTHPWQSLAVALLAGALLGRTTR